MNERTIDKLALIEIQDRKVLFVRSKGQELFYSPGGKREENETDTEALMREIKEEINVELVPETMKYLHTFIAQAHGKPEGTLVEIKCYTAKYKGELQSSAEIEELIWLNTHNKEKTTETGQLIVDWLKENNLID